MRNAAPELVARTAGFTGVFLSLIVIGFWDRPEFIITPQQHFESVILTLHQNDPENENSASEKAPVVPEPEKKQEPEPKPQPEPEPKPLPEPKLEPEPVPDTVTPPPASKPLTQEIKQEIKPQPQPELEQVKNPEPPVKKEPPKEPKPKAAPDHKPVDKPKKVETKAPEKTKAQDPVRSDKSKVTASAADNASAASHSNAVEQKLQQRQAQAQLSSILVQEIKNRLKYPRNAVRRRLEGTVMMEFTVKDGVVISFKISKSSGHKILDEAARKLAQTFVSFNTGLPSGNSLILIPVKYELL